MSSELAGFSLATHSVVCAAAVLGIWKLHGESSYGKQPQGEMEDLRVKLLRAISLDIVATVESALSLPETVDIEKIIVPGGSYEAETPRVAELGKERLLNGISDFIKSDIGVWKSLRLLDRADARITNCLQHLRRVSVLLLIIPGAAAIAAGADKYALLTWELAWLHVAALAITGFLLAVAACCFVGVMWSTNRLDTLKDKHDDLS